MNIDFNNSEALAKSIPAINARIEKVRAELDEASEWADSESQLRDYRNEINILNAIVMAVDVAYLPHYFDKG